MSLLTDAGMAPNAAPSKQLLLTLPFPGMPYLVIRYRRFSDISLSELILNSAFLLTIGIGYPFAPVNLCYRHQARDGERGFFVTR